MTKVARRFETTVLSPFVEADVFEGFLSELEVRTSAGDKITKDLAPLIRFDPNSPPLDWIELDISQVPWGKLPDLCGAAGLDPNDLDFVVMCQSRTRRRSVVIQRISAADYKKLADLKPIRITDDVTLADRSQFEVAVAIILGKARPEQPGAAWRPGSLLCLSVFEWERIRESGGLDPTPLKDEDRDRLLLPSDALSYVVKSDISACQSGNPIQEIYVDSRLLSLAKDNPDDPTVELVLSLVLQDATSQILIDAQLRHDLHDCGCVSGAEPQPDSLLALTLKRASKGGGYDPKVLLSDNALGWPSLAQSLVRGKRSVHNWIKGQEEDFQPTEEA